jgi:hypothetical protein
MQPQAITTSRSDSRHRTDTADAAGNHEDAEQAEENQKARLGAGTRWLKRQRSSCTTLPHPDVASPNAPGRCRCVNTHTALAVAEEFEI